MTFPATRMRRLRRFPGLRDMVAETVLTSSDLMMPCFVRHGTSIRNRIPSMPGNCQMSVDVLVEECRGLAETGVPSVILFVGEWRFMFV